VKQTKKPLAITKQNSEKESQSSYSDYSKTVRTSPSSQDLITENAEEAKNECAVESYNSDSEIEDNK